jgi:alcohol dehydrogenase (NADP+)
MATDYKFEGWMGLDSTASEGNMVWQEFTPKKWEETDIDIKISHCGVCGSDLHTLRSGWVSLTALNSKPNSCAITRLGLVY